jgi:hypothetical protein
MNRLLNKNNSEQAKHDARHRELCEKAWEEKIFDKEIIVELNSCYATANLPPSTGEEKAAAYVGYKEILLTSLDPNGAIKEKENLVEEAKDQLNEMQEMKEPLTNLKLMSTAELRIRMASTSHEEDRLQFLNSLGLEDEENNTKSKEKTLMKNAAERRTRMHLKLRSPCRDLMAVMGHFPVKCYETILKPSYWY